MKFLFPGENTSTSVYFAVTCHSISSGGGVMNSRAFNMGDRCHSHHPRRQKVELPELFDGRKASFYYFSKLYRQAELCRKYSRVMV